MLRKIPQPDGLVFVLLSKSAPTDDRVEAAGDLGMYDGALAFLIEAAMNLAEDDRVAEALGESVADIWMRVGGVDVAILERMHPAAQREVKLCMNL